MKSYGGGEELPIVKSKQGLFKKPEFYLADQKYDSLGHGDFVGQNTGKLEGPSQRAIKGKGKKAKNVRVYSEFGKGDPIFLQDTSPMKQKYSSQSGMESAVKRWQSPHKLTGDPNAGLNKTMKTAKAINDEKAVNEHMLRQAGFTGSNKAKKSEEKATASKSKKDLKQEKRDTKQADKEAYKKTDEFKEKRAKQQDTVQAVGRAMMAYAGLKPGEAGESATEKLKKQKAPSEKASSTKTNLHTDDSGDVLVDDKKDKDKATTPKFEFRKGNQGESKADYEAAYDAAHDKFKKDNPHAYSKSGAPIPAPQRRGDIEAMSAMMRKIKNPRKVVKEKISGSEFGAGVDKESDAFTGTKKTITKGDKTVVKTKKKGAKGDWKKKTSEKTVGDEYGSGDVKYVDKSKYSRKSSEKDPHKSKRKKKVKEIYKGGEKVKDTYKTKRVSGTQKSKGTMKDGVWK